MYLRATDSPKHDLPDFKFSGFLFSPIKFSEPNLLRYFNHNLMRRDGFITFPRAFAKILCQDLNLGRSDYFQWQYPLHQIDLHLLVNSTYFTYSKDISSKNILILFHLGVTMQRIVFSSFIEESFKILPNKENMILFSNL